MNYIVQPYLFWKGHYKKYFENLLEEKTFTYIYCNDYDKNYTNSNFIKNSDFNYEKGFLNFILARIVNSLKTIKVLNSKVKDNDTIYLLEFEPFSILYFYIINRRKKLTIIQTIHSVDRIIYSNKIKNLISIIQRKVFKLAINLINNFNTVYVVHYKYHKDALEKLIDNKNFKIKIIDYPSPDIKIDTNKKLSNKKSLLIFGLVREDKGIYDFLEQIENADLNITVAGKVIDNRINTIKTNFKLIDKFLNENEIKELFTSNDFALIPYGKNYTGGAGPLKDALSYGTPIIATNHPIFNSLVSENNLGFIFNNINDLENKIKNIENDLYSTYSLNCLNYAKNNTWYAMRIHYLNDIKR
ncbi:MAG: hypothetical protein C0625_15805 [Arcobacter sp.]|nr:MAG: hypothetical protein C0625_15805 [Arcobacter sp.]